MGIAVWIEGIMGKKGTEQGNSNAGGGEGTAALLGGKEKKGKALVPLTLGAAMQGRDGQPLGYLTRDSDILLCLQGRELSAKQGNVNCCPIHLLQSTSAHPKYSPWPCKWCPGVVSSGRVHVLLCKA